MGTVIKIEDLSKQYRLGLVSTRTLSHDLNRLWKTSILGKEDPYLKIGETNDRSVKGASEYVWALKDINLEVQEGEVLGIIGRNGAGKSTLLKILSRVTTPTTGVVRAKGRIASLLEVGTGFHQEMTGRENIFMNGAIMGMTKAEIRKRFDEIVDFAGVERYIDTPVKRYSSGMTVRLGFAVAAHLEPEILVVDEVLAVGDAEFQKKALGKMQDVSKGHGRTILFVSHNLNAVSLICSNVIILKNGQVNFNGKTHTGISKYLSSSLTINNSANPLEIKLNEIVAIQLLSLNPTSIYSYSEFEFTIVIESKLMNRIGSIVLLFYNELDQRVGIVDLRSQDLTLRSSKELLITIKGMINNFPGVPGNYKIGLYLESTYCTGDFLDLSRINVISSQDNNMVPYSPVVSGIFEIRSRSKIQ
jgi:lipopolysaccharide transport system ATP-binding protein